MIKKICPICDNCIGAMNYCRVCHQFIRRPVRREIRYYLNESHPVEEDYCEYHRESDYRQASYYDGKDGGKMTKADYLAKKAAQTARTAAQTTRTAAQTARTAARKGNLPVSYGQNSVRKPDQPKAMLDIRMKAQQQRKGAQKDRSAIPFIVIMLIYLLFNVVRGIFQ